MNLEELRQAMASDATEENKKLKKEVKELKEKLRKEYASHKIDNEEYQRDCYGLANRCYLFSKGDLCAFCELGKYHCSHALSDMEKIQRAKELMKQLENE